MVEYLDAAKEGVNGEPDCAACPLAQALRNQEHQDFVDGFLRYSAASSEAAKAAIATQYKLLEDVVLYCELENILRQWQINKQTQNANKRGNKSQRR